MAEDLALEETAVLINTADAIRARRSPASVSIEDDIVEACLELCQKTAGTEVPEAALAGCSWEYLAQLVVLQAVKLVEARAEANGARPECSSCSGHIERCGLVRMAPSARTAARRQRADPLQGVMRGCAAAELIPLGCRAGHPPGRTRGLSLPVGMTLRRRARQQLRQRRASPDRANLARSSIEKSDLGWSAFCIQACRRTSQMQCLAMLRHICAAAAAATMLSGCIAASDQGVVVEEEGERSETIGVDEQPLGALPTPSFTSIKKAPYGTHFYEFSWTPINGATRYRFQCDHDGFSGDICANNGCDTEFVPLGGNNTSFVAMLFPYSYPVTLHYCRVRAGNSQQGSLWSPTAVISVSQ